MQSDENRTGPHIAPVSAPRLELLNSVMARTGMSRKTIGRRAGVDFPSPVRLGPESARSSRIAFVSSEVDRWITDRIADSRRASK